MSDPTDEELERVMRRKLLLSGASNRGQQFTPEQQAIANKLIGKHNVERLERREVSAQAEAKPRRFRPTPVFIHYEYWWVNGGDFMSYWNMARVENGKRTDHHYTADIDVEINRLRAAGFTVKEIKIEGAPSLVGALRNRTHGSGRKTFSERFGAFDPEVDD